MKILVVDDEPGLLKLIKMNLAEVGHQVACAETFAGGLAQFQLGLYDLVLCDIGLPDGNGLDLLSQMHAQSPETPIVMITAHGSIQSALTAMKNGAYDYIQKPFEIEEIGIILERAQREKSLVAENIRLKKNIASEFDFSKIIGKSAALQAIFDKIRRVADTRTTVLILGESGTGKELIAKAIHFNSPRHNKPFVVLDCSAIAANLLESELFGHVKGAFTGADRPRKGLCEEAHGGTLFLDEIGEMPLDLQSKLLRLLQEQSFRKVGETQPTNVDIRILAATNRNLEDEVKNGRFREDLFYRLNVVALSLPPLRERKEDIPILCQNFLERFSRDYQRKAKQFAPDVMERLLAYDWPGNIRQLHNVMEQVVVMSTDDIITADLLPPPFKEVPLAGPVTIPENEWDLKKAIERVTAYTEECLIRKALAQTKFNKTKAAQLLGLSRRALIYKTQEYKIHAGGPDLDDAETEDKESPSEREA